MQSKTKFIITTIAIVVVAAIAGVLIEKNTQATAVTPVVSTTGTSITSSTTVSYTLADVAAHNTASDCWTVVDGNVYNITAFIPSHPGGAAIIQACGTDASTLFHAERQHVAQNAQATLDTYVIGKLQS